MYNLVFFPVIYIIYFCIHNKHTITWQFQQGPNSYIFQVCVLDYNKHFSLVSWEWELINLAIVISKLFHSKYLNRLVMLVFRNLNVQKGPTHIRCHNRFGIIRDWTSSKVPDQAHNQFSNFHVAWFHKSSNTSPWST